MFCVTSCVSRDILCPEPKEAALIRLHIETDYVKILEFKLSLIDGIFCGSNKFRQKIVTIRHTVDAVVSNKSFISISKSTSFGPTDHYHVGKNGRQIRGSEFKLCCQFVTFMFIMYKGVELINCVLQC